VVECGGLESRCTARQYPGFESLPHRKTEEKLEIRNTKFESEQRVTFEPGAGPMPRPIHFEVHVDDPQRAIEFYRTVLGWSFQKWEGSPLPYWMVVTGPEGTPGINGGLMPRRYENGADKIGVNAFICTVDVADMQTYIGQVQAHGGQLVVPTRAIPGVGWLCYCKDTEGNIFGMMQPDTNAR
jgi:uncharacterized protein